MTLPIAGLGLTVNRGHADFSATADLDQETLSAEVEKSRRKKTPLTIPGLKALREEYVRTPEPMRLLAGEAIGELQGATEEMRAILALLENPANG